MKKQIYLIIGIIMLIGIFFLVEMVNATLCKEITEINEVPCEVQTPGLNCSNPAYIFDNKDNSINYYAVMALIDPLCTHDCVYNFSFNYNNPAAYEIDLCDNLSYSVLSIVTQRTTTTNNVNFGTPQYNVIVNGSAPITTQAIQLASGGFNWIKEFTRRYWLLLIIAVLIVIALISSKFRKKKTKIQ